MLNLQSVRKFNIQHFALNIEEQEGVMRKVWIVLFALLVPVLAAHLVLAAGLF